MSFSLAGVAASIYSGIGIEEWKERKIRKKIKVERIGKRSFLVIEEGRKFVKKCFKGFGENLLDDVVSGVANWLRLRGVSGVQRLVRLDVDDMCVFAEYVEGKSLREYITERGGVLSEEEAAHICLNIAMVLKEALSRGIVHRDLKPEHVIISQDGKVTIVDWEFSARLDTKPNVSVGTLDYTPPEGKMRAGGLELTENYDVYSLGVMLLEMLTGNPNPHITLTLKNENLKKLLEEMTSSEPKNRANIDKVIKSLKQMYIKEEKEEKEERERKERKERKVKTR
jgi:serine/threonine protein kinase